MLDHCYGAQLYSSICTTSTNSEKGMHIDEADDDFQVIRRSKALRRLSFGSSAGKITLNVLLTATEVYTGYI